MIIRCKIQSKYRADVPGGVQLNAEKGMQTSEIFNLKKVTKVANYQKQPLVFLFNRLYLLRSFRIMSRCAAFQSLSCSLDKKIALLSCTVGKDLAYHPDLRTMAL